jgi:hypothetical protein
MQVQSAAVPKRGRFKLILKKLSAEKTQLLRPAIGPNIKTTMI